MKQELLQHAEINGANLPLEEIQALLEINDPADLELLWQTANRVREREVGDAIWLRGLVEFSNYCHCNCLYCGLQRDNQELIRYRMSPEEILATVARIHRARIGTVVLQSGEDPWWTADRLADLIHKIKTDFDIAVTLSLGYRPYEELEIFRNAGADRYLLRHETANALLYDQLHPDSTLTERIQVLHNLRALGYEVGSGCMVGLPGQTVSDLAMDLYLARLLDVDMFGVGPFIPHPATPLAQAAGGTVEMTYKMIAAARIVLRNINMPVTTALATLDPDGREKGWQRGANVVMPNATPAPYRQQYELYQNKRCLEDTLEHCTGCLARRVTSIQRTIGRGHGGTFKERVIPNE